MAVTAGMVKELREMTGVGMSDCKKALVEADGDMEKAVESLRKKGLAASAKKEGRIAAEGVAYCAVSDDNKIGAVVEVNSETDFVAKNEKFKAYVAEVGKQVLATKNETVEAFMEEPWIADPSVKVSEALSQEVAIIGEKLSIRRFEKFALEGSGAIVSYVHGNGKIAVMIELACEKEDPALLEMGKNVCMQIAALNPKFITSDDISEEFKAHEVEILKQQAMNDPKNAGKPENIIEKMIVGRLNKEFKELCLIEQPYVKDGDMTVKQYIDSVAKQIGAPSIEIKRMVRFETGEGLAKKEENFAEEVAKAAK